MFFVHTENSDPQVGEHLTRAIGSLVVIVPALAEVPERALAPVYIFANGVPPAYSPRGPLGFQIDVFDSVPGDERYSPLRRVYSVRWTDEQRARELRAPAEVTAAARAGEMTIERSGILVTMPVVRWRGGSR